MAGTPQNNTVLVIGMLVIGGLVSGGIAVLLQGSKTEQSIKSNDIAQIDVMREQIATLRAELEKLSSSTLSRSELENIVSSLNETIVRRFGEDVQVPIGLVRGDAEKNEDAIVKALERIAANETAIKFIVSELAKHSPGG